VLQASEDVAQNQAASQASLETVVRDWIGKVIGVTLGSSLADDLASGEILCQLANRIRPGIVKKVAVSDRPFPRIENIQKFIHAAREFGVTDHENVRPARPLARPQPVRAREN
jgi:hypothetical protein